MLMPRSWEKHHRLLGVRPEKPKVARFAGVTPMSWRTILVRQSLASSPFARNRPGLVPVFRDNSHANRAVSGLVTGHIPKCLAQKARNSRVASRVPVLLLFSFLTLLFVHPSIREALAAGAASAVASA